MRVSRGWLMSVFAGVIVFTVFPSTLVGQKGEETKASPTTIMGCLSQGVEAGCIILKTSDGKTYSLHGKNLPSLDKGLGVTAQGTEGGVDTCMQGTVFQVSSWQWNRMKCPKESKAK